MVKLYWLSFLNDLFTAHNWTFTAHYSTVTETPSTSTKTQSKSTPATGHFLVMSVRLTSSNLWLSPYSRYQQQLFNIIRVKHEDNGLNFKEISDLLVNNDYKTPRGKVFTPNKCWSIYMKKKRSIQRFSRTFEPDIKEVKVDIVNYQPAQWPVIMQQVFLWPCTRSWYYNRRWNW